MPKMIEKIHFNDEERARSRKYEQLLILEARSQLDTKHSQEIVRLRNGWNGEIQFDEYLQKYTKSVEFQHIKNYSFMSGETEVQIDNIVLAGDKLLTFEIKNFNFDVIYSSGPWKFMNGKDWADPLVQVGKQRDTLHGLINDLGFNMTMLNLIVFINPRQTIYQMPVNSNIVVPSNLKKRLDQLITPNDFTYHQLLDGLHARRVKKSIYDKNVEIPLEKLNGGVFCQNCNRRMMKKSNYTYFCSICNIEMKTLRVVRRLIEELKILNLNYELNARVISRYSDGEISASCIRRYYSRGKIRY